MFCSSLRESDRSGKPDSTRQMVLYLNITRRRVDNNYTKSRGGLKI